MLAKDIVKIKFSQEGYLPNYPPHLISDEEMCQAFLTNEISYFYDTYILKVPEFQDQFELLINAMKYHIARFLSSVETWQKDLPNWVYSYMLGHVVNDNSDVKDRHDFLVKLNTDNMDDEITADAQIVCYNFSLQWVNKLNKTVRIEYLDENLEEYAESEKSQINSELEFWGVSKDESGNIISRPPTMFGEPHVIKLLRLNESS